MNSVVAERSFVVASVVNCALSGLASIVKIKVEGVNFVRAALVLELPNNYGGRALNDLERLRATCTVYLSLVALVLVGSSVYYTVRSTSNRAFPAVSLMLAVACLILTFVTQ